MPTPNVPSTPPPQNVAPVNPTSTDATTAGAIAQANYDSVVSGDTNFSSLADLRRKAPKLYNMMMQGIAWNIITEMQHHQARLKSMWDEMTRNG